MEGVIGGEGSDASAGTSDAQPQLQYTAVQLLRHYRKPTYRGNFPASSGGAIPSSEALRGSPPRSAQSGRPESPLPRHPHLIHTWSIPDPHLECSIHDHSSPAPLPQCDPLLCLRGPPPSTEAARPERPEGTLNHDGRGDGALVALEEEAAARGRCSLPGSLRCVECGPAAPFLASSEPLWLGMRGIRGGESTRGEELQGPAAHFLAGPTGPCLSHQGSRPVLPPPPTCSAFPTCCCT